MDTIVHVQWNLNVLFKHHYWIV